MNALTRRAAARVALSVIVLAALIFISAGTTRFWQGWLFCLSFSASSIATTAYLLRYDPALVERRLRFGPRAESRPIQRIIQAINLAIFVAVVVMPGLDHRFGWSGLPAMLVVAANVLVVAGFGFILLVFRENPFAASTIAVEAGQRVISTGPYAHVRHPMYAGAIVLVFSVPIALGSLWGLVPAALLPPLLVARIVDEERALSAELPGYDEYRRAVRYRLIPLVW